MRLFKFIAMFGAALVTIGMVQQAQATLVMWDTPTQISQITTSDLQVSTNGSLHSAANLGDVSVTATVNSQPFLPYDTGNFMSYDSGKITLIGTANAIYSGLSPQSTLNADYDALLNKSYSGATAALTFNSLTIGGNYEIQLWSNDSRAIGSIWNRTTDAVDHDGGLTVTLKQNNGVNAPGNNLVSTSSARLLLTRPQR